MFDKPVEKDVQTKFFQVRTVSNGAFVSSHNTLVEAEASASVRNDRARELGIEERYTYIDLRNPD